MKRDRRQFLGGVAALAACGRGFPSVAATTSDRCEIGGPLTVHTRRVQFGGSTPYSSSHCLSPDGRTLLLRSYRTLSFLPVDGAPSVEVPLEGPAFGSVDDENSVAWSDDSQSIWLLTGETASPSGFSIGPFACARRWMDGRIEATPALRDPPGRLDRVHWLDGAGLGIACFDTRGGYYRPEQPNVAPTLGVIEAANGRIRSRVSVRSEILTLFDAPPTDIYCTVGPGAVMRDGRVRALVTAYATVLGQNSVGGLVLWTEGQSPTVLPKDTLEGDVAFVDGGRKLLVRLPLQAAGVIYERRPSPSPTPVSGDYAGLYDLESDRWVWRLSGRSTNWGEGRDLAVSASGRRALIGLPESCDIRSIYGLIDVRTGRILQRLASYNNSPPTLGFDGEEPWTASGGVLDLYGEAA